MAIEFYEHFEREDNIQRTSGGAGTITTDALSGARTLNLQNVSPVYTLPSSSATKIIHFLWRTVGAITSVTQLVIFGNGSTSMVTFGRNSGTGVFQLSTTAGVVASSVLVPAATTVYHLQFKAFIDNSVGVLELKVNNSVAATFTGDTLTTAFSTINTFTLVDNNVGTRWDDIVVDDTDYLGDVRIKYFFPLANGSHTDWTGTFADVDERPNDGDTTKISSLVDGDKESFTYAAHGLETTAQILAVCPEAVAKGSAASIMLGFRIGGTDYMQATQVLGPAYGLVKNIVEADPTDSNDWTLTDLVPETVLESDL